MFTPLGITSEAGTPITTIKDTSITGLAPYTQQMES